MRSLVRHCVFLLAASHAAAAESAHPLENEVVARVNTQAISLRDIETRMINSGPAMLRLFLLRETLRAEGQWDEPQQKRFDEIYLPAFREELGRAIREELMRQDAQRQGLEVDRGIFEQHLRRLMEEYRAKNLLGAAGHSIEQIQRDLHRRLEVETFRQRLVSMLDLPSPRAVRAYYEAHAQEFQQGATVKVRRLRVAAVKEDGLGRVIHVPDAEARALALRARVAGDPGSFAHEVRNASDDADEVRQRGGIVAGERGSLWVQPQGMGAAFAVAVSRLQPGEVSEVFRDADGSFVCVQLLERRSASVRPLDEDLYRGLSERLTEQAMREKEREWLRKALDEHVVLGVRGTKEERLPLSFFFPDEPEAP